MRDSPRITRRSVLMGGLHSHHHISSAVVFAFPARREEIGKRLAALPGVEVHASEGSRIVVTIEGPTSGFLGETLTNISTLDGVISANMVFEHIDEGEDVGP
jgi:periplasmic nitrate reductase NapD